MKTLIIHGTEGHPQENWFPWLKTELEKKGHEVFVPQLPTPEDQTPDNWTKALNAQVDLATIDNIIGHSCGATFMLQVLETLDRPPKKTVFTGIVFGPIADKTYNPLVTPFWNRRFDWDKIKANKGDCLFFHGDNDPHGGIDHAETVAGHLDAKVTIIENAGHINEAAGYLKFPQILPFLEK